jgi:transcriptional regulator with GAF, ATPase, and Fis domain
MALAADDQPEFESMKELLLGIARERSVDRLLNLIARGLARRPHTALARIWLIRPGDICDACAMEPECPDHRSCLHLVASDGQSLADPEADWTRTSGRFSRIPLGAHRIGRAVVRNRPEEIVDIRSDIAWITDPDWVASEAIIGFAGYPISHQTDVHGALALFTRIPLVPEGRFWMQMTVNHAAISIANARAFSEISAMKEQIELENTYLREELDAIQAYGDIVGQGAAFQNLMNQIELVAPTDASVLILGQSGTGKELVAREIHRRSRRSERPLIKVNCASIPQELYESEFFGHTRGAFTGATQHRAGRFEAADGGTLFLDEVGEIPLQLQSKLLRVLQEGQFERVGEDRTRRVDVRIIAASNQELKREVERHRFRQDLYYRLNVVPITLEPLSRRKEDIPLLAEHFLNQIAAKMNCPSVRLTRANLLELQRYDWPGNIRELKNLIERAVILSQCGPLRFDLPRQAAAPGASPVISLPADDRRILTEHELKALEAENIRRALNKTGWKIYGPNGAARLLGLKPSTLSARVKKIGIKTVASRPLL